ncbi:MAG: hypothetical protein FWH23_01160 [Bacteroidales bacterium]|nr:hypothetical protein [Bacteroidales bacterium]MCL2133218.1 hypothetical protein [Bacteroidales bacterium]
MKKSLITCLSMLMLLSACSQNEKTKTMLQKDPKIVTQLIEALQSQYADLNVERARKGVAQVAALWYETDGSTEDFIAFCKDNYVNDEASRSKLFASISDKFELLIGHFNKISVLLKEPIHMVGGDLLPIDYEMGAYEVSAHFNDDMFASKVAFTVIINFPSYNLADKKTLGENWTREEWGYARLGDIFTSRVPANIQQEIATAATTSDNYITDYNIKMGHLMNEAGEKLFPEAMSLISHWGLRDELKSNYSDAQRGLEKQRMIYTVMKRIINQEIPQVVINNDKHDYAPLSNKVYEGGKEITAAAEPDTRYAMLLGNFNALRKADPYIPEMPTYIQRAYEGSMEFSKEEIREMFTKLVSSPEVAAVAGLIKQRLGRDLEPFDIWYDGFKSRSGISEDLLSDKTRKLYPDAAAFERGLPAMLIKLGFTSADAQAICKEIRVDAARGSGHAWGAAMKGDQARLRTRILPSGMDYKGYNIAIHEFGHNVEQTISLYDVDYYMMNGVPSTAFTEALAFVFQQRDLQILEMAPAGAQGLAPLQALDIFWGCYEIMGVSLVDMGVWEWLYANPNATPAQLKNNVVRIAKEIWNAYYAPILGEEDSPILAIYSHMIDNPLYLANYPMGHLIELQMEEYLQGKHFAAEVLRMYRLGRLTPQQWMKEAMGAELSVDATLRAAAAAVAKL